jgi:hypothetical protein
MAEEFGYIFKIERDVLHWHSASWAGVEHEVVEVFQYGAGPDILSLDIDADFRLPLPTNISARGYDPRRRAGVIMNLEYSKVTQELNVGSTYHDLLTDPRRVDLLTRIESLHVGGTVGLASHKAQRRFLKRHWNAFQINLKVVGNPRLLATKIIRIKGTGSPLVDGKWYIAVARHTVTHTEYITELQLKHPPKSSMGKIHRHVGVTGNRSFSAASRTFNAAQGVHEGFRPNALKVRNPPPRLRR